MADQRRKRSPIGTVHNDLNLAELYTNGTANRAASGVQDDIVERLSDPGLCTCGFNEWECLPCAAKAEIERLRAEHTAVDRLVAGQLSARLLEVEAERDAERALADQLYDALCPMLTYSCCPERHFGPCDCSPEAPQIPEDEESAKAITAWLEARRG